MAYKYRIEKVSLHDDVAEISAVPIRKPLRFVPGQYASIGYISSGRASVVRCFSLIGNGDGNKLRLGVRITGPFTKALAGLHVGSELRICGPFGSFYIDPAYDKRVVMLASGIGITPFLSMLEQPLSLPTTLLYSNRSATAIPFQNELLARARQQANFEIGFFASEDLAGVSGVVPGRISEQHIARLTSGIYEGSTYFICGSTRFMQKTERALRDYGVPDDRIVTESFAMKAVTTEDAHLTLRRWTYGVSTAALGVMLFGIAALDLSRAVPKLAAQQTAAKSPIIQTAAPPASNSPTASSTPPSGDSASTNSASSTTTGTGSPSASSSNTAPQPAPQQQTYYQPPVSSVS